MGDWFIVCLLGLPILLIIIVLLNDCIEKWWKSR